MGGSAPEELLTLLNTAEGNSSGSRRCTVSLWESTALSQDLIVYLKAPLRCVCAPSELWFPAGGIHSEGAAVAQPSCSSAFICKLFVHLCQNLAQICRIWMKEAANECVS